jgi:hypothetical protein
VLHRKDDAGMGSPGRVEAEEVLVLRENHPPLLDCSVQVDLIRLRKESSFFRREAPSPRARRGRT